MINSAGRKIKSRWIICWKVTRYVLFDICTLGARRGSRRRTSNQRKQKYQIIRQLAGQMRVDEKGILAEEGNGVTWIHWEEVETIGYAEPKAFFRAYEKKLFENGMLVQARWKEGQVEDYCDFILIDNAREYHEAIWQMVLRHCIGREDVKIDPHWQAFWEAHQQG